jgi:hypothetical protein
VNGYYELLRVLGHEPVGVRAWRFHSPIDAERGALAELDGETVRVLRVSSELAEGREMECVDGTLWIVETEAA